MRFNSHLAPLSLSLNTRLEFKFKANKQSTLKRTIIVSKAYLVWFIRRKHSHGSHLFQGSLQALTRTLHEINLKQPYSKLSFTLHQPSLIL